MSAELIDDTLCIIFNHVDFGAVIQKELTLVCKQWRRLLDSHDFGYGLDERPIRTDHITRWFRFSVRQLSFATIVKFSHKINWNTLIGWQTLCTDYKLGEAFIVKFADKLNWTYLSEHHALSEHVLITCKDRVVWEIAIEHQRISENVINQCAEFVSRVDISRIPHLSEEYLTEKVDQIIWPLVPHNAEWSEEFIALHADRLDWSQIMNERKTAFAVEFAKKHAEYIEAVDWNREQPTDKYTMTERYYERYWRYVKESRMPKHKLSASYLARHGTHICSSASSSDSEDDCHYEDNLKMFIEICKKDQLSDEIIWKYIYKLGYKTVLEYYKLSDDFINRNAHYLCWSRILKYQPPRFEIIAQYASCKVMRWDIICRRADLTPEFIELHAKYLCWHTMSTRKWNAEFINKYAARIYWDVLVRCAQLNEDLISQHEHRLDWDLVSQHQHLSEEFMILHDDRINWNIAAQCQKLSEDMVDYYIDRINQDSKMRAAPEGCFIMRIFH